MPTILSRCVVMKLRLVSTDKIEQYLFHHHFSEKENASIFAEYAYKAVLEKR